MTPEQREIKNARNRELMRAKRLIDPEYGRAWLRSNPEKARAARRRWSDNHPERERAGRRKQKGVKNPSGEKRNGPCEICLTVCDLHYDHNHQTGEFRGWLCGPCNRALGCFKDDPCRLSNAIRYLADYAERLLECAA